jgi:hypothetical protein
MRVIIESMIQLDIVTIFLALLAGLAATLAMTMLEIPAWKKFGLRGVLEWHENQVLSTKFFRLSESDLHVKGIFLLHFANGGLGGIGFALALILFPFALSDLILSAIGYGLFLWLVTLIPIHKPITGITPWKHPDGMTPMMVSLAGHITYGIVLCAFFVWQVTPVHS